MTGEMSQFDAENAEEWALHRSIAKALKGKIHTFDVYQGPWIEPPEGGRLWIESADDGGFHLYYQRQGMEGKQSEAFGWSQTRKACRLARNIVAYVTAADRLRSKGEKRKKA